MRENGPLDKLEMISKYFMKFGRENRFCLEEFVKRGSPLKSGIFEIKNDRAAIVTVISDDGFYESGKILNSLAKELNLHVTVAGYIENLLQHFREWKKIERENHIEIVNHSYSHLRIDDKKDPGFEVIYHEYVDAKKFLEKKFKTPAFCFVTPENITSEKGRQVLQENGFLAVRQGEKGENALSPIYGTEPGEWLNLKARGIGDVNDTNSRNDWIDMAIRKRSWLIEMWHDISPNGDVRSQPISTCMAKEHLSYISQKQAEKSIWAAPFTQAVSYLYKKQYCSVAVWQLEDKLAMQISRTREDLPWKEFNAPLSIWIKLPEGWKSITPLKNDCTVYRCNDPQMIAVDTEITSGVLYFTRN